MRAVIGSVRTSSHFRATATSQLALSTVASRNHCADVPALADLAANLGAGPNLDA